MKMLFLRKHAYLIGGIFSLLSTAVIPAIAQVKPVEKMAPRSVIDVWPGN